MHRINTTSVGVVSQSEGIIFVEQNPAPVVFLTAADTDIQSIAAAYALLPNFPALRVANLLQLQHQISIDTYAEQVLEFASVIILRLLGGRSYWTYGLEVVQELVQRKHIDLIVMPGDDALDPYLISHSTLGETKVNRIWRYFNEGGVSNIVHAFQYISDCCLSTTFNPPPVLPVPRVGVYEAKEKGEAGMPRVGILFYRAHYLVGNTKVIDALCFSLIKRNLEPVQFLYLRYEKKMFKLN